MKTVERSVKTQRWLAIVVAICAGVVLMPAPIVRTAAVPILEPVQPSVAARLSVSSLSPATTRSRAVRVNLYALPTPGTNARPFEDNLELALFPDVTIQAVFERFDTVGGSGTWIGRAEGEPMSSVTLAYRDGLLTGSINSREGVFEIRPAPEADQSSDSISRLHVVSEMNPMALQIGPDIVPSPADPLPAAAVSVLGADGGNEVDLMVVYTPAAVAQAGGPAAIGNLIALAVSSTNAAYARSGINHRIRLVHTALMPYAEANKGFQALADLREGREGLAGVTALRDARGADLVVLIADLRGFPFSGVAYISTQPGAGRQDLGFSVVCAEPVAFCASVAFPHELGHNMGSAHDWFEVARSPFPFGYGHIDRAQGVITLMSYNSSCAAQGFNCRYLGYFSSPDVDFVPFCSDTTFNCDLLRRWFYPRSALGVPEGSGTGCRAGVVPASPCEADNRRLHNTTAGTVANYRQSR